MTLPLLAVVAVLAYIVVVFVAWVLCRASTIGDQREPVRTPRDSNLWADGLEFDWLVRVPARENRRLP